MAPDNPFVWSNLGMIQEQFYQFDEAEVSFRNGIAVAKTDEEKGALYVNWACMLVNKGDWFAAEPMCRRAVKYRPQSPKAKANLGICCLALRNWREGWPLYDAVIGFDGSRRKIQYKGEKTWAGKKGQRVVVYGEQGLGDEIMFSSMLPDLVKDSKSVVLDCTDRLAGLMQRSFPQIKVYGTRWEKGLGWDKEHTEIDASMSIAELGRFYRLNDESFPGKPFLKADPERVEMWRALFRKLGKPVVGVAWTGGVAWTAAQFRQWNLDDLLPVFRAVDAVFVSLQYKDAGREIREFVQRHPDVDLRQYPFGTLTQDYDDTAAMVEALDFVFSMQTAVIHLAGGLGKDCWCFVNKHSAWRYGASDATSMPWYGSVRLWRQNDDGTWPLERAGEELRARFRANPA